MNYISRHAESAVEKLTKMFGAVLVADPRQVGKTTMLRRITKDINYVSLDDLIVQASAREQSGTFDGRCFFRKFCSFGDNKKLSAYNI